jgi:hypothetical protein
LLADYFTLMVEVISSSETSVLSRATWRHIPEDGILRSHRRENLKPYQKKVVTGNEKYLVKVLWLHIFLFLPHGLTRFHL